MIVLPGAHLVCVSWSCAVYLVLRVMMFLLWLHCHNVFVDLRKNSCSSAVAEADPNKLTSLNINKCQETVGVTIIRLIVVFTMHVK